MITRTAAARHRSRLEGCTSDDCQQAAADALGYEALELIGHDAHATFHAPAPDGDAYPAGGCYIADAIQDGVATSAEEDSYLRADGLEIPVEVTATPLTDECAR